MSVGGVGCGKSHGVGVGGGGSVVVVVVGLVAGRVGCLVAWASSAVHQVRQSRRLLFLVLHDLCAAASGLVGSRGLMWSAVNGSSGRAPSLQMWQCVAVALMICAVRRYSAS